MSDTSHLKTYLDGMLAELTKLEYFQPREEVERRIAREARQERLERAKPAVTDDDLAALIAGRERADTHAMRAVRWWVSHAFGDDPVKRKRAPRFLVLSGERGRGKTVAAAWVIANEVSRYITAGELRRIRSSHNARDVDTLFNVNAARLLVLDDLGVERLDDSSEELLFELLNERQNRRYTLITTNLTEEQMRARYGDRAVDRITLQGGFIPVTGDNLRDRKRAAR